jgi:PAS domain S-box-containing protein
VTDALRKLREELLAAGDPSGLVPRVDDALEEARVAERRDGLLREVVRSRNLEFEERVLELSVLKEVGDIVSGSLLTGDPLPRVLAVLLRELAADAGEILRLQEEDGDLKTVAAAGDAGQGPDGPAGEHLGDGIGAWVAARGEPLIVGDLARDVRFKRHAGCGSLIAVPLRADDSVLGVLVLSSERPNFFQGAHSRILRIVAGQVASTLAGLELHERLQRFNTRLESDVKERTLELEQKTEDLRRKNDMITDLYFSLEEAQRELEDRNREVVRALVFHDNIVETVNVGIGVIDSDGRIVTWNRAMESITRGLLPKEEVLGKPLRDVPVDVREPFGLGRDLDDALSFGRAATRTNQRVDLDGEGRVFVNVNLMPVPLPPDGGNQVIAVLEDVTLNTILHDEQVKAERLAAITETMVSVNHEVNNPLAVILGYSQMMLLRLEGEGADFEALATRARSELARIEAEALRIRAITAKLAALVDPVVTDYPASDVRMVDLGRSR